MQEEYLSNMQRNHGFKSEDEILSAALDAEEEAEFQASYNEYLGWMNCEGRD